MSRNFATLFKLFSAVKAKLKEIIQRKFFGLNLIISEICVKTLGLNLYKFENWLGSLYAFRNELLPILYLSEQTVLMTISETEKK